MRTVQRIPSLRFSRGRRVGWLYFVVLLSSVLIGREIFAEEVCYYRDGSGEVHRVSTKHDIPSEFVSQSKCVTPPTGSYLANPEEIELEGNLRTENLTSELGPIALRWSRSVEKLFGRTPERAVADAARTAARALRQSSFDSSLRNLRLEWNMVFLDESLPETQIPAYLVSNCHPAWMTPPANIYVVGQRVAAGCGGRSSSQTVADRDLAEVLLHEMGHVVEYVLLEGGGGRDRMRAEGFATWFEQYAADYSRLIPSGSVREEHLQMARRSLEQSGQYFVFRGTGEDYARASLYFHAIQNRKNVSGIMDLYQALRSSPADLQSVVKDVFHWSDKRLEQELLRIVEK